MAKLSEFYSEPPQTVDSLWTLFDQSAKAHPNNIAVTVMHQPADHLADLKADSSQQIDPRCLHWAYADLHHASLRLAAGFQQQGVQRGTTMTTFISNGIECVLLLWVSTILQLSLAPLDPRLLDEGREEQLRDYLRRLGPTVVVVPDENGGKRVDEAAAAVDVKLTLRLCLTGSDAAAWQELSTVAPTSVDPTTLARGPSLDANGTRIAAIYFTSGASTGRPKGCPRNVRNLLSCTVGEFGYPDPPSRTIIHTPNSGTICQAFLFAFGSTGKQVIFPAPSFSPAGALDAIEHFGAEMMVAIPVMSRMFEAEMGVRKRDVSGLKHMVLGGDMVTVDAREKFKALFPQARVGTGHGMSEGHSIIGWRGFGIPSSYPEHYGILAAGYPMQGTLLRICDEEGKVVPRGEAGELQLGGPCMIDHYLEDAQPEAFYGDDRGAWMLTGDRASMNDDGLIFIIGRNKDIIKKVGLALSPAVAESVLNGLEGVEVSASVQVASVRI